MEDASKTEEKYFQWAVYLTDKMPPTWTNQSKSATPSFLNYLKRGSATRLAELADFTFESVVFPDGTVLRDLTFNDLVDQVWANTGKSASPTFTNQSKS